MTPAAHRAPASASRARALSLAAVCALALGPALPSAQASDYRAAPDAMAGGQTGARFLPLGALLRAALLRRLDAEMVRAELAAQLAAFAQLFGRAPDYVDGHQHVQLFPQVRDAFLEAVKDAAPQAWVRQCGRARPWMQRLDSPKALLLDTLSATFRARCKSAGVACNPGFAGAYDMVRGGDFGAALRGFLDGLPDGGLVMCHPGFVDDMLREVDDVTQQREREFAYLAGDDFPRLLEASGVTLARR